ncbi:MAG: hypothetical protein IIX17_02520 [Tidjanibacter sp.]|nr:hypothetical protein [Tidjanibacter sp.]
MRITYIFITLLTLLFNQYQQPSRRFLTEEDKETCISVFEKYLSVEKEVIDANLEIVREMYSSSDVSADETESIVNEIVENIQHVNVVLEECIELVKQSEIEQVIEILENERVNIYAHPANNTSTCLQLHIAMAMLYAATVETEEEYLSKFIELFEYNRLIIEVVQANQGRIHPEYEFVLSELHDAYDILGREKERQEVEETLYQLLSEE